MTQTALIDIETFPNEGFIWGTYKQRALKLTQHTTLCSYTVKWIGGEHITRAIPDTPHTSVRDDYALVKEVWDILDKADIVIAHYGDGFDLPVLRARFAAHNMLPPSPWRSIDTKKESSKVFHWGGSHSLAHICSYLGIGEKLATGGYDLWDECLADNPRAWAKMKKYNRHDVVLLEKLYLRLRPWMKNHPNLTFRLDSCPRCGSTKLQSRGEALSQTRIYAQFHCQSCGHWPRSVKSIRSANITS